MSTKILERVASLQSEKDNCEREARDYEQKARDCRGRHSEIKSDLAELGQSLAINTALVAVQKATQSAEQSRDLAQTKATELIALVDQVSGLEIQTKELIEKLQEALAKIPKEAE